MSDNHQHIYIIANRTDDTWAAPSKVGITTSLNSRLRTLQTGCPYRLEVFAAFRKVHPGTAAIFERCVHQMQANHRMSGEWFRLHPETMFRSLCTVLAETIYSMNPAREEAPDFSELFTFYGVPDKLSPLAGSIFHRVHQRHMEGE